MNTASRREFLKHAGLAAGGAWASVNATALFAASEQAARNKAAGADWTNLTPTEAESLAAVADQIIPPGESPGAAEIGAVYFMDAALGGFMAGTLPMVRQGVQDLDTRAQQTGGENFAGLGFDAQTEVLEEIESTGFFGLVHRLTILGVFSQPSNGGNRGQAGWQLLGFEPRHVWQPPFGYYDAEYARGENDAST